MAKFLQDTLEEIALERKSKQLKESEESKAYEFAQFLKKVIIYKIYNLNYDKCFEF